MKTLLVLMTLVSPSAFATTTITCAQGDHSLVINVDNLKSNPPQSAYSLFRDGAEVANGSFKKVAEGTDSFLGTWVWGFESYQSVVGVSLVEQGAPQAGTHKAKADVFVTYQDGFFDGTTVDCQVLVK